MYNQINPNECDYRKLCILSCAALGGPLRSGYECLLMLPWPRHKGHQSFEGCCEFQSLGPTFF